MENKGLAVNAGVLTDEGLHVIVVKDLTNKTSMCLTNGGTAALIQLLKDAILKNLDAENASLKP